MAADLYTDARALASTLRARGYADWAVRIEDDIAAGSTATEILMRLSTTLTQLTGAEPGFPEGLRRRTGRLLSSITRALL